MLKDALKSRIVYKSSRDRKEIAKEGLIGVVPRYPFKTRAEATDCDSESRDMTADGEILNISNVSI